MWAGFTLGSHFSSSRTSRCKSVSPIVAVLMVVPPLGVIIPRVAPVARQSGSRRVCRIAALPKDTLRDRLGKAAFSAVFLGGSRLRSRSTFAGQNVISGPDTDILSGVFKGREPRRAPAAAGFRLQGVPSTWFAPGATRMVLQASFPGTRIEKGVGQTHFKGGTPMAQLPATRKGQARHGGPPEGVPSGEVAAGLRHSVRPPVGRFARPL